MLQGFVFKTGVVCCRISVAQKNTGCYIDGEGFIDTESQKYPVIHRATLSLILTITVSKGSRSLSGRVSTGSLLVGTCFCYNKMYFSILVSGLFGSSCSLGLQQLVAFNNV